MAMDRHVSANPWPAAEHVWRFYDQRADLGSRCFNRSLHAANLAALPENQELFRFAVTVGHSICRVTSVVQLVAFQRSEKRFEVFEPSSDATPCHTRLC